MSRCLTWFPSGWFYQENPSYIRIREILQEMGILWKESAPELMGVKLFLDNVQLVQLKKYGNNAFIH